MDIKNSQNYSVKSDSVNISSSSKISQKNESGVKFSDELNNMKSEKVSEKNTHKNVDVKNNDDLNKNNEKNSTNDAKNAIKGLNDTIDELNELNQKDEKSEKKLKNPNELADRHNKFEEFGLIDNNMNVQEQQDKFNNMQMGANMNFNSNGQPFAEFVNQEQSKNVLKSNAKDLAEEKAIMSTMEENIAIANRNMAMAKTKTVENEHGIQKVDKKSNLVVDTIVSYDSVVMDKADVEFFANLVDKGVLDINEVQASEKSSRVSKTLADLLAKAMNDNKPVRIDFDNNISVIIKIDRAGKISADFLPSSQVAEAYLKENLPLLKQRFDDNNIDYNELNQRQRKQQDTQDNRKKGRKDE